MFTLNQRTLCTLYLFIVLNSVASAGAIYHCCIQGMGWPGDCCTWFYERLYCTDSDIYCFT